MNNNIFTSNYSTSNPFTMAGMGNNNSLDDSLIRSYAQLEELKNKQYQLNSLTQQLNGQQKQTVFTDIANEFKDLSDDEVQFIVSSPEYQKLNNQYQTEFSNFLIKKFSGEYLAAGNNQTLEKLLYEIREQKAKYKNKFADEINEIRDQNKELLSKNNELAENNKDLETQLKSIKKQLTNGSKND